MGLVSKSFLFLVVCLLFVGAPKALARIHDDRMALTLENFVGVYKAQCHGVGPLDYKDKWNWKMEVLKVKGQPLSLGVYFSEGHFRVPRRLFTFSQVGKRTQRKMEQTGDMCNDISLHSSLKNMTLAGSEDTTGFLSCGPLATYHAHYRAQMVIMGDGLARYDMNYRGFGGDYKFSCDLRQ